MVLLRTLVATGMNYCYATQIGRHSLSASGIVAMLRAEAFG